MARRILIVDDEDDIREVASVSLQAIGGFEVTTAASGAEALELARTVAPDAVLLDVMMPGMDGPTTFRRLQEDARTRSIPVLFLTAKVQAADRRQFAELGVAAVLSKPFDPVDLPRQLVEVLGWR